MMAPNFSFCLAALLALAALPRTLSLAPPRTAPPARASGRTALRAVASRPKWRQKKTLADEVGGSGDAADAGLTGTVDVVFVQGNATKATKAIVGQPLSEVASQADQFIRYKCKKGECGTCEVKVDGKWIRSCVSTIPYVAPGATFEVTVKPGMIKSKKSSRFFSVRSFVDGWVNNILGMIGFVRTGASEGKNFKVRLDNEAEIARLVAERKAKKAAEKQKA
jgi:hypothetical protein